MARLHPERDILAVADALNDFPYPFVLVGGGAVPFLLTDPVVSARSTKDFDIVVRIATQGEYYDVEQWLRNHGFTETKEGPICRWKLGSHLIDVMPALEEVLGFSNQWYEAALESATDYELAEGVSIPVVAAPPFIGAKIEAFRNRGDRDYYASPDLEDVVTVLNGRPEIVEEFGSTSNALLSYVATTFEDWLENRAFQNALPGHLPNTEPGADRTDIVKRRMKGIIEQSKPHGD